MSVGRFLRKGREALRAAEPLQPLDIPRDELPAWAGGTALYHQVGAAWESLDLQQAPANAGTPVEGADPLPRRPR